MNVLVVLPLILARAADPVPAAEDVKPGWIALITVVSLCLASLFLWFSMRKQLRRIQVPREGEETAPEGTQDADSAAETETR